MCKYAIEILLHGHDIAVFHRRTATIRSAVNCNVLSPYGHGKKSSKTRHARCAAPCDASQCGRWLKSSPNRRDGEGHRRALLAACAEHIAEKWREQRARRSTYIHVEDHTSKCSRFHIDRPFVQCLHTACLGVNERGLLRRAYT